MKSSARTRRGAQHSKSRATAGGPYARVYAQVKRIPRGRIATYGQIAELAGIPRKPRQVGHAMASLDSGSGVPWHRVVNARGEISRRADWGSDDLQRILLESEGVAFDECGRISVRRFGWKPRKRGTDPN